MVTIENTTLYLAESHLEQIADLKEEIKMLAMFRLDAMLDGATSTELETFDIEIRRAELDLLSLTCLAN